ncbi:MAG: arylsulfatase, partial [Rhodopirellula bahusiensis]
WAPGRIPAGTSSNAFATNMDLLPTIASVTGVPLENDRKIDGVDLTSTFTSDESSREEFVFYSAHGALEGIRMGDWKYLRKVPRRGKNAKGPAPEPQVFLFHLSEDIGEQNNLVKQDPERAEKMRARMEELNEEITSNARPVWRTKANS